MAARKWTDCNVFQPGAGQCEVWRFDFKGKRFVAKGRNTLPDSQPFPANVVGGGWKSLVQPRLNVAWLPADGVFLRVVQLPACAPEELTSMVELQLEKLSPLPVTQIVWNAHSLGDGEEGMQTVLVVMAGLDGVESFLGQLEGKGLFVDRLDVPAIDQLRALKPTADGAWIMPDLTGVPGKALVGWWAGGVLRSLGLVELPAEGVTGRALRDQLMQMAWAGEIEGWLSRTPQWTLIAGDETRDVWLTALQLGGESDVEVGDPATPGALALSCANRSAQSGSALRGLLPEGYATRYRQQFNDRLWMRGLGAALVLYILAVIAYFGAVGVEKWRLKSVETQVASLGPTYTNALDLRDTYQVLNNLHELKYAALDCWKATAEVLPEDVVVDSLSFSDGSTLRLSGTAPEDAVGQLRDFEDSLLNYEINGKPMFTPIEGKGLNHRKSARSPERTWNLSVVMRRSEVR